MKAIIEWMADNHVATNLFMLFIIFIGFMSLKTVNVEVFPEVAADMIQVQVAYPGASPDEIEESINVKIEEQLKSLEGIDRITSTANENIGVVNAELSLGEDLMEMKDKIKSEVDRIITFPANAEEPIVKESLRKVEVIQVAIFGNADELTRKRLINKVRDDLLDYEAISQISLESVREYEISINVSEERLRSYNISFDQVTQALRVGSLDLPGGKVTTKDGEILLRTKATAYKKEDYENIILSSDFQGNTLRIKDVAEVIDGFEDSDLVASFNGEAVAMAKIYRVGDESAIAIADAVYDYIETVKETLPSGVEIDAWRDQSRILKSRIDLLVTNALQGLALVVLCLALFLEIRLAMWVSVGIVISFVGSFFFMSTFDASINMISLFAFILVIGIVVDDAIVVGENIFTFREAGYSPAEAAKKGVVQVMTPVFFSVSTTLVAFAPLLFVDGFMGKIMSVIPIIVIAVLVLSLVESLMILPAHLSTIKKTPAWGVTIWFHKLNDQIHAWLDRYIKGSYTHFLRRALEFRYLTVASSIFVLLFSIGMIMLGFVKFTFFPVIEADNIIARITMPVGTSLEKTQSYVKRIEDAAFQVQTEFDGKAENKEKSVFRNIYSVIGDQPMIRQSGPQSGGSVVIIQGNIAEINIELLPSEEREFSAVDLMARWRELVGNLSGVKTLTFQSNLLSSGNDVQIELSTRQFSDLQVVLDSLKNQLAGYSGVFDIRDDFLAGKQEYKLKLKPEAATLGISQAMLARQVRQAFYGVYDPLMYRSSHAHSTG
jgi:multidrug efflux pump subunit AcrB